MSEPKVSVITIARNEERHLGATLQSIQEQTHRNLECIVVEGGSTDRTPLIAGKVAQEDPRFRLVRQQSRGISSAFNEGALAANGDFLIFLNGGDLFSRRDALALLVDAAVHNPGQIVSFKACYIDESGAALNEEFPEPEASFERLQWGCSVAHMSTLIPRQLFVAAGLYCPAFRSAMDYELWLRYARLGYKSHSSKEVVALHRKGGFSFQNVDLGRVEGIAARLLHLPLLRPSLVKDLVKLTWLILKSLKARS